MNKNGKNLLLAISIGDGHISKTGKRFQLWHSLSQLDYLTYKVSLLNKIGIFPKIIQFENNGHSACRACFNHVYANRIRKQLYKTGTKVITKELLFRLSDEHIAIWYMDDGSLYKKKGKSGKTGTSYELCISTYCKSEKEANDIIDFFKVRYNATFTIKRNKGRFSVRCGKKAAIQFLSKIEKFIPNCMSYKKTFD